MFSRPDSTNQSPGRAREHPKLSGHSTSKSSTYSPGIFGTTAPVSSWGTDTRPLQLATHTPHTEALRCLEYSCIRDIHICICMHNQLHMHICMHVPICMQVPILWMQVPILLSPPHLDAEVSCYMCSSTLARTEVSRKLCAPSPNPLRSPMRTS